MGRVDGLDVCASIERFPLGISIGLEALWVTVRERKGASLSGVGYASIGLI